MFVLPLIDTLLAEMPVGDGVVKDDTGSQPAQAHPNRLYCWPLRLGPQRPDDDPSGRVPDPMLRVSLLYTLGARGEPRAQKRERALTEALDAATQALIAALYANRRTDHWWDLYVEQVVYDAVRTENTRGYGVNVALRLNNPLEGAPTP